MWTLRLAAFFTLLRQELLRTRGALATAGVGVVLGTGALTFFLALGVGARAVLLGQVFPIDRLELEPPRTQAGLLDLLGGRHDPPGITEQQVRSLEAEPGVERVSPRLRFRFPAMARGGKELLGTEIGTHEMMGDGVEPALLDEALRVRFVDPWPAASRECEDDTGCAATEYCERPSTAPRGRCSAPVPALVSRYLVELFDHGVAPAHGLPPVAGTLLTRAEGVSFDLTLGTSLLGRAPRGSVRRVKVRVIGVSPEAIDLGVTLPVSVVKRWNEEYAGADAAARWSSVVVRVAGARDAARIAARAQELGLVAPDTRSRDVSVLVNGVLALLVLVAGAILLVAALDIRHTFRSWVEERRHDLALYRALGARATDVQRLTLALALVTGCLGGAAGCVLARIGALLADWRARHDLPDFPFKPESFFAFPAWLWVAALGFAAGSALLGAWAPARRAARTDPALTLQSR